MRPALTPSELDRPATAHHSGGDLVIWFVNNPVKVAVGVLLVALFGILSLMAMPVQLTPEVQIPKVTVETLWPGGSPQEVEREIVQEQEEQLQSVEGVTKMTSESMDSRGTITMEFAVGSNMSEALLKVNSQLQQVREYPEDAEEPVIKSSDSSDSAIAWFVLTARPPEPAQLHDFVARNPDLKTLLEPAMRAHKPDLMMYRLREAQEKDQRVSEVMPPPIDVPKLRRWVEDFIEARFERVEGVAGSNVFGGEEEEMQVIVDPELLAARQLTIQDIRVALRSQNQDTSGGDFWEGKRRYVVRTLGQFRSVDQVANVIIARRDGIPVYVKDVATVQHGYKKPDGLVRRFGTAAIAVNCQRESSANVLDVMNGLKLARDELNEGILKQRSLILRQVYDETLYINSAISLVNWNMLIGGCLTIAVLLLFLRSGRSTIVIGLAIPVSIIGTFLMLAAFGRSLNVISLAGMAFAVGMLVDNAVVVLENIYRHYQLGATRVQAASRGAREVWGAVLASTLTTLAVFVPILFVKEEAGQLFRDIALAISCAVGLSLIVSLTVIPVAASRILRRSDGANGHTKPQTGFVHTLFQYSGIGFLLTGLGSFFVTLIVGINQFLHRSVILRFLTFVLFVGGSILLSYAMWPPVEYLPNGNRNLVIGILLPPPGYNLDQMVSIGTAIEPQLFPYWEADPSQPESKELDFPAVDDFFYVARGRQLFMGLRAADDLKAAGLIDLVRKATGSIPGMISIANQTSLFQRGLGAGRNIDIEITGPELETLIHIGRQIMGQVPATVPNSQALPRPSLDLSSPEVHVVPRWEQAADMNVSAVDLGYTVDALVDGAYATDYFVGGDKIDLRIIGRPEYASRTQDLEQLSIATPAGELIPLSAIADISLGSGPEQVNHRERQRAITIQVTPPPDMAIEDAMNRITDQIVQPLIDNGTLGTQYRIGLSGTADKLRQTWKDLRLNVAVAILITYLLMAALFESWLYPFIIMVSVPLAAVGGFIGLTLLNQFVVQLLDVLTMLGFVILVGTTVNNAILIVHQALNFMRYESMDHNQAILESVRVRIRPIFMTTCTTVLGLMPLVLQQGAGNELYRGLGSVVLGGLSVSAVFTLFLVPSLFSLTLDTKQAILNVLRKQPETIHVETHSQPVKEN